MTLLSETIEAFISGEFQQQLKDLRLRVLAGARSPFVRDTVSIHSRCGTLIMSITDEDDGDLSVHSYLTHSRNHYSIYDADLLPELRRIASEAFDVYSEHRHHLV